MAGDHFDASSDPPPQGNHPTGAQSAPRSTRPFLGIQFQCCGTYARIHLTPAETAFVGKCPRCGRRVEFPVSNSGSTDRFFTVY